MCVGHAVGTLAHPTLLPIVNNISTMACGWHPPGAHLRLPQWPRGCPGGRVHQEDNFLEGYQKKVCCASAVRVAVQVFAQREARIADLRALNSLLPKPIPFKLPSLAQLGSVRSACEHLTLAMYFTMLDVSNMYRGCKLPQRCGSLLRFRVEGELDLFAVPKVLFDWIVHVQATAWVHVKHHLVPSVLFNAFRIDEAPREHPVWY